MDLGEAVGLLGWKREQVKTAITRGVQLPVSKDIVKLVAVAAGSDYDITEESLDQFIERFHGEQPGKHPPVAVRRELLVESGHRCAVCGIVDPLHYHHMIEFAKVGHYDPVHMLVVCGNCHGRCTARTIDYRSQREYKKRPWIRQQGGADDRAGRGPIIDAHSMRFSWDDLREIITAFHDVVRPDQPGDSRYDLTAVDMEAKNTANRMNADYFKMMREHHEPYFCRIRQFLGNPINEPIVSLYHEVVDELRAEIAAEQQQVEDFAAILRRLYSAAVANSPDGLRSRRRVLNILLSFMYFNCDIGRKDASAHQVPGP
jgi:hypothetical protein